MKKPEIIARVNVIIASKRTSPFSHPDLDDDVVGLAARDLLIADLLESLRDAGEWKLLLAAVHIFHPELMLFLINHRDATEASQMLARVARNLDDADFDTLLSIPQKRPRVTV